MVGDQTNPEKDSMDEDPIKILFGDEIGGLCDDGFEGSNDEQRIFMEILYGNDTVNVSKRCVDTGAVKFEMEDINRSNALSDSNWKDLTGVSLLGMKDSSGEDVRHANEHFGCSLKHRKLADEIPNNENNEFQSKPSKEVGCSGHAPDFVCTGETIRCHLVESCSHGIISSCLLLKPHKETDVIDDAYNWKAYNKIQAANPIQRHVKQVTLSRSIFGPVSESSVSNLLPTSSVIEEIPMDPHVSKEEGPKESDILMLGPPNVTPICVLPRLHGETDILYEADGGKIFNKKRAARSLGKYGKEVSVLKTVMHPISQENSISDVLCDGAITAMEDMPVAPTVVKGYLESDCLKSGAANVTSGCVVFTGDGETNIIDEADDQDVSNATGAANPLPMHVEEVTVLKAAVPATSQESSSLKLLPNDAINALEEMPVAHIAVKQLSDESAFSLLGPAEVTSGCDLVSRHGETDIIDEADRGKASDKTGVGSPHGKHYNEVSPMKDIMLPLSPERSASSLLPNNATTAFEEIPEAPIVVKEGSQESGLSKLGLADVILGHVPIRRHGETGGMDVTDDGKAVNQTEVLSPDEKCVKEVTVSETMISPVSQESSVPKLLTNDAIPAVEEIPVAPIVFMGKSQQSDLLKSGGASATPEKVFEMNLHTHNHMQINHVESSTQDVVAGGVLLKPYRKAAVTNEVDDIDRKASSRSKRTRALERSVKKVTTLKGTLSSVSPQSDASQLLPTVTVEAIEKKAVAFTVVEEGSQESNLLKSGMANVASEGLKRSLRSHSCKHTNLVEPSSQGAVSNYAILKQCREDTTDLVDDGNGSNEIEVASVCGNDDKIASKLKVTSVSVSPKSFPSEHLLTGEIIAIEENPRALTIAGGGSQEVGFSVTDMVDEASNEDFIRDLRPRLREHVSLVLTAAGWDVVIRERGHRPSYFDTLFATPVEKLICKLPKAWRSCGNNLFAGGIRSVQKQNMREWADINDFWNGLSITLTYIEKEMQETETPLSLAQRWRLLDPYVITVCIDRKIGALRSGKAVKVVNGVAVVSNTFVRTKRKYTKKNQIVGRFRDQVGSSDESLGPVPESDITSNQMDTCLSIVQSVAGHSECNTSASVRRRKRALSSDASAMTLSNLSPSEDLHMNVSVARESEVLYLEPSKSQDLKLDESVLKSPCEDHQEEKACNGMIKLYKDEALAEDDTQGDFEDAMIPELQSSLFQSNPNSGMELASTAIQGIASVEEMQKKTRRKYGHTRKKFKSLLEVKGIKSISKHKKAGQAASPSIESHSSNLLYLDAEQEDFATGDFKKSRKLFGSMIASVHNGKLLIANQETEISMAEQQMSHPFSHESICHKVDGSYQNDVLAHRKTQPHRNCCVVDDKIENKLDLLFHQGKDGIAFGSNFAVTTSHPKPQPTKQPHELPLVSTTPTRLKKRTQSHSNN